MRGGPEHLKIETRLIDERSASVMGEYIETRLIDERSASVMGECVIGKLFIMKR